jgi:DNA-binding CsgD family transcriptional regulator
MAAAAFSSGARAARKQIKGRDKGTEGHRDTGDLWTLRMSVAILTEPVVWCCYRMKRHVLIFGLVGGALVCLLRLIEYRFLILEHSFEIYGGLIALTFAALGIWLGVRVTGRRREVIVREVPVPAAPPAQPFVANERKREELGITPRELEILGLVAQGLSNREIAGKLFVSENTVKTHCSRAFEKLGARRRTQAVQLGKEMGLL